MSPTVLRLLLKARKDTALIGLGAEDQITLRYENWYRCLLRLTTMIRNLERYDQVA